MKESEKKAKEALKQYGVGGGKKGGKNLAGADNDSVHTQKEFLGLFKGRKK